MMAMDWSSLALTAAALAAAGFLSGFLAGLLGIGDHLNRHTVFHRVSRVERFVLRQHQTGKFCRKTVHFDHWCIANGF